MENKKCGCNPENGFICQLHLFTYENESDFELRKLLNSHLTDPMFKDIKSTSGTAKQFDRDEINKEVAKIHNKHSLVEFEAYCKIQFQLRNVETKN